MHPRRGVEAVTALLWLASGRFLAGIGRVIDPNLSKAAQPKSVYWNAWAAATGALVAELRFASSSLRQGLEAMKGERWRASYPHRLRTV